MVGLGRLSEMESMVRHVMVTDTRHEVTVNVVEGREL